MPSRKPIQGIQPQFFDHFESTADDDRGNVSGLKFRLFTTNSLFFCVSLGRRGDARGVTL